MYGIRGRLGAMFIEPKLLARQFDRNGTASVKLRFGGLSWTVTYFDPLGLDYGQYRPELRHDGMPHARKHRAAQVHGGSRAWQRAPAGGIFKGEMRWTAASPR